VYKVNEITGKKFPDAVWAHT